jgi:hypothetical protein
MRDVYVTEANMGGWYMYFVFVDGCKYDEMIALNGHRLTWAEQNDMASYYREALDD